MRVKDYTADLPLVVLAGDLGPTGPRTVRTQSSVPTGPSRTSRFRTSRPSSTNGSTRTSNRSLCAPTHSSDTRPARQGRRRGRCTPTRASRELPDGSAERRAPGELWHRVPGTPLPHHGLHLPDDRERSQRQHPGPQPQVRPPVVPRSAPAGEARIHGRTRDRLHRDDGAARPSGRTHFDSVPLGSCPAVRRCRRASSSGSRRRPAIYIGQGYGLTETCGPGRQPCRTRGCGLRSTPSQRQPVDRSAAAGRDDPHPRRPR